MVIGILIDPRECSRVRRDFVARREKQRDERMRKGWTKRKEEEREREREREREKGQAHGNDTHGCCVSSSCRNSEENQFDGSPLAGVRLAIISEHAEEIIGCSGVPSKTSVFVGNLHRARRSRHALARACENGRFLRKQEDRVPDEDWRVTISPRVKICQRELEVLKLNWENRCHRELAFLAGCCVKKGKRDRLLRVEKNV